MRLAMAAPSFGAWMFSEPTLNTLPVSVIAVALLSWKQGTRSRAWLAVPLSLHLREVVPGSMRSTLQTVFAVKSVAFLQANEPNLAEARCLESFLCVVLKDQRREQRLFDVPANYDDAMATEERCPLIANHIHQTEALIRSFY